jgi:hypothetical protein
LSHKTEQTLTPEQAGDLKAWRSVEIYYGMADSTKPYKSGVWHISGGNVKNIHSSNEHVNCIDRKKIHG